MQTFEIKRSSNRHVSFKCESLLVIAAVAAAPGAAARSTPYVLHTATAVRKCHSGARDGGAHLQVSAFELHLRQLLHRGVAAVQMRRLGHELHERAANVARHFCAAAHVAAGRS